MKLQELNQAVHQGMLQTKKEVTAWLHEMKIERYTINKDLSVDVNGDVDVHDKSLTFIPVQFNKVNGTFYCQVNELTSLEGSPQSVNRGFYCSHNNLTSLQGSPQSVGHDFYCSVNNLTSLEGSPQSVGHDFDCSYNKLTSLHNIHKQIRNIGRSLILPNAVTSHILGLMRIKGLVGVGYYSHKNNQLEKALDIINNNLQGKGNIHQAQEQLLDAGLKEFAQL